MNHESASIRCIGCGNPHPLQAVAVVPYTCPGCQTAFVLRANHPIAAYVSKSFGSFVEAFDYGYALPEGYEVTIIGPAQKAAFTTTSRLTRARAALDQLAADWRKDAAQYQLQVEECRA